jgi:hypothetical protein
MAYSEYAKHIALVFPLHQLPALMGPLEEDIEIIGFLPLSKSSTRAKADCSSTGLYEAKSSNEEQLMRISDLSVDAIFILQQAVSYSDQADFSILADRAGQLWLCRARDIERDHASTS